MTYPPPPETASCDTCRHFHRSETRGQGDCHRFPPVFAGESSPNEKHHWHHPIVTVSDWCGEYAARQGS